MSTAKNIDANTEVASGETFDFATPYGFVIDYSNDNSIGGVRKAGYPVLKDSNFRTLEGKMLTICDATFTDREQREAFKRIIKNELRNWFSDEIDNVIDISNGQWNCEPTV